MATVREVALELGVSPNELLDRLAAMGAAVPSDSASLDPTVAAMLRAGARRAAGPPPPPPPSVVDGPTDRSWASSNGGRVPARVVAGSGTAAPPDAPTETVPWTPPAPPGRGGGGRPSSTPRPGPGGLWAQLAELPLLIVLAFAIAVLIKTFLVQAFFIPSASMFPTLRHGDRVLVEKISYRLRDPAAGDVVVFAKSVFGGGREPDLPWYQDVRTFLRELLGLPTGTEQDYIKRVVAVGGDTVSYAGNPRRLTINGAVVPEPYVKGARDRFSPTLTAGDCRRLGMAVRRNSCVVPDGEVFVMGDNRTNSEDSRVIGPIAEDKIVGHAFVIIWPPSDIASL